MFILPPNCIVPSATSLTMRPVFPSFLYFISHTPCGRSGRHQIDTFESTWPGQNWALTEWPVNVDSRRLVCAKKWTFRDAGGDVNRPVAALGAMASCFETSKTRSNPGGGYRRI